MKTKNKLPMRFREKVKITNTYKELSSFQKTIYKTSQNIRAIENSYKLLKNVGLEDWQNLNQNRYINALIVQELYILEMPIVYELITLKTA
jgi:hypothetical protein